jgi:glycosyltransferase involved in cell wall biosynthesis
VRGRLLAVAHTGLVSGAERVLLRVLAAAAARGWDPLVVAPGGPLVAEAARSGLATAAIPELTLPAGPRPLAAAALAARHARAARTLGELGQSSDLVLVNGVRALPAMRLARLRAPTAWLVHDVLEQGRWRAVIRRCGPAVDLAVAVSAAAAAPLAGAGFPVRVAWNGTPWPVDPAPRRAPDPPVVGCAALVTAWKGQHVLLDAVAALGRDDVTVELIGGTFPKDAAYARSLRRRAGRPDLAGRVRLLGHVADPLARMRGWAVAVIPSVDPDAGPLVALEAMSLGLPLVVTDHGGSREVLGDAGLLVPPRDPEAMAAAIGALLDPQRRARCWEAGRRIVAGGFVLEDRVAAMVDAVESVAGLRHARR